jgi:hypothetical protein
MNEMLPWGGPTERPAIVSQTCENGVELGLYHVTGPYQLAAYVLAKTGQDATLALTHGEHALWSSARVFDDQCQAEYIGQRVLPRSLWNHFLADIESPFGLVIREALN